MRKVGAFRAFFGNLCVGGLGYLYLGRPFLAIASWISGWLLLLIISVIHPITTVAEFYAFLFIGILLLVIFPIHAAVIATREKFLPVKKYNRWWVYLLWMVLGWVMGNLFFANHAQILGFESFRLPSESNSPTLERGDVFLANTRQYIAHAPEFGEFAVFRLGSGPNFVKRLVGLPGDTVELRDGVLIRNGIAVNEPYLHAPRTDFPGYRIFSPVTLGTDEFFLMGDYRDNSRDSRTMGSIKRNQLQGRAEFIWFSNSDGSIHWDRFGKSLLPTPSDNSSR